MTTSGTFKTWVGPPPSCGVFITNSTAKQKPGLRPVPCTMPFAYLLHHMHPHGIGGTWPSSQSSQFRKHIHISAMSITRVSTTLFKMVILGPLSPPKRLEAFPPLYKGVVEIFISILDDSVLKTTCYHRPSPQSILIQQPATYPFKCCQIRSLPKPLQCLSVSPSKVKFPARVYKALHISPLATLSL